MNNLIKGHNIIHDTRDKAAFAKIGCAGMMVRDAGNDGTMVASFSPSPLIPLPSRERGKMVGLSCFHPALHLWIADQVRNDMVVVARLRRFPRRRESTGRRRVQPLCDIVWFFM